MSILHVDWNATCSKQVETQFYELHSTRSVRWFCQRKENLKDPRRQIRTKACVRDNDIGRKRPVELFICAEKKRKFSLKCILSSKVEPVVHQHIWLPNHVGREPENNFRLICLHFRHSVEVLMISIPAFCVYITKFKLQVFVFIFWLYTLPTRHCTWYWSHHHILWRSMLNLHLPIPEKFV